MGALSTLVLYLSLPLYLCLTLTALAHAKTCCLLELCAGATQDPMLSKLPLADVHNGSALGRGSQRQWRLSLCLQDTALSAFLHHFC